VLTQSCRIQAEAVEALAEWKALFAEQVTVLAKELAKNSSTPCLITLDHYRQAAKLAAKKLATAVQNTGVSDDCQEAA
jgi:hypothetical protein